MPNKKTIVRTNSTPNSIKEVHLKAVTFAELWAAYPHSAPCTDPSTGKPAFQDECAIRFGTCLAGVGITNKSFKGEKRSAGFTVTRQVTCFGLRKWRNGFSVAPLLVVPPLCQLRAQAGKIT
ncbi:hypothetical protein LMG28614_06056 [Paraburkholderia ultramafica]|uniref:Uncharacterized protein n=1 Tax=Paraburkholderia ultramafica TaxID=1544867 RepID=A0A6S7DG27_9BURK|nr:hypothetical protein [Paraburkholderia ultramafica]CAB3804683.1 hypothetical protein LMG28614_06056 [Paraburkholderia ultramafica]